MARIPLVMTTSHSPFLYTPPEYWNQIRAKRSYRDEVPYDSDDVNKEKYERCQAGLARLRAKVEEVKPDVMVIFGDDQKELFDFKNFPALGMFLGESYGGYKRLAYKSYVPGAGREHWEKTPEHWTEVKSHPQLARHIMRSLFEQDFDLSFSVDLPDREEGMGHAFMRPTTSLTPNYDVPVIPIFVNCYFPPQPTARRCYQLGRAIRKAILSCPLDLDVAVIGSGGLWHTPGAPDSWLDEGFDMSMINAMKKGDIMRMAEKFDAYREPADKAVPEDPRRIAVTGIPGLGGPPGGGGETRNWVAAAAVADGAPGTIVDYVPVYASPIGMGFAYWDDLAS
jgi:Catalytic LigB subunit of aromatic ring-opening dioxygenase